MARHGKELSETAQGSGFRVGVQASVFSFRIRI